MRSTVSIIIPLLLASCSATTGGPSPTGVATGTPLAAVSPDIVRERALAYLGDGAAEMDPLAMESYLAAQETAFDSGAVTAFQSSHSGATGTVSVRPSAFVSESGAECLRYSSSLWIPGQWQLIEGDACRADGGSWEPKGVVAR